jgi:hypothetical protein
MKRHFFNLAAAISLVLCVAVCALWLRSLYVCDLVGRFGHPTIFVRCESGLLRPHWTPSQLGAPPGWTHRQWPLGGERSAWFWLGSSAWAQLGFMYAAGETNDNQPIHQLAVPLYAVLLAAAILPAAWLIRRARRSRPGCCAHCGYDLRESPDRCPECGTAKIAGGAEG